MTAMIGGGCGFLLCASVVLWAPTYLRIPLFAQSDRFSCADDKGGSQDRAKDANLYTRECNDVVRISDGANYRGNESSKSFKHHSEDTSETQADLDVRIAGLMGASSPDNAKAKEVLQDYKSYREGRGEELFHYFEQGERRKRMRDCAKNLPFLANLFTDYESAFPEKDRANIKAEFAGEPNPDKLKKQTTNKVLVSLTTGMDPESMDSQWDVIRTRYAQQALGWMKPGVISDDEFHSLAKKVLLKMNLSKDPDYFGQLLINLDPSVLSPQESSSGSNLGGEQPGAVKRRINENLLEKRIDLLEATIGILLSDPEINNKFRIRKQLIKSANEMSKSTEEATKKLQMADAIYAWEKEYRVDPVAFKKKMEKASPEEQRSWQVYLDDLCRRGMSTDTR